MFRKPDDDLFARIFDDGQPGDSRMEWMRDGLKELREVPPHGLSNERLRDRLLGTALAPAKPATAPWWSWAWAPVAAAAIAVVILPRLRPAEAPSIIVKPGADLVATTTNPRLPGGRTGTTSGIRMPDAPVQDAPVQDAVDVEATLVNAAATMPVSKPAVVRSEAPSVRVASRQRRQPAPQFDKAAVPPRSRDELLAVLDSSSVVTMASVATVPSAASKMSVEAAGAEPAAMVARREPASDPLVLLEPEIDSFTGAAGAVEISSPANLSVGG